ncbi:MAG TPA: polysaccharide deacetylase family protein [Burkholderiaceae bacterium]
MRWIFNRLAPGGAGGRLSVLIFHRVLAGPDPLLPDEFDAVRFEMVCGWLRRWFNVIALDTAARQLAQGTLPERPLAITFDDGYTDNHDVALPILRRYALPATFFVATGFLDGGRMWNDTVIEAVRCTPHETLDLRGVECGHLGIRRVRGIDEKRNAIAAIIDGIKYLPQPQRDAIVGCIAARCGATLPDNLMMRSEQVAALRRAGMQIGAHTVTHPILATLSPGAARDEIVNGKRRLEAIIDEPVSLFAYPNGRPDRDYTAQTVALVREAGFDAAVTTAWGAAGAGVDPFQIPRFTPWDRTQLRFGLRLAHTLWASRRGAAVAA